MDKHPQSGKIKGLIERLLCEDKVKEKGLLNREKTEINRRWRVRLFKVEKQ